MYVLAKGEVQVLKKGKQIRDVEIIVLKPSVTMGVMSLFADDTLVRLLTYSNVIITGHRDFFTRDDLGNIAQTTLDNIHEFEEGKHGKELTNGIVRSINIMQTEYLTIDKQQHPIKIYFEQRKSSRIAIGKKGIYIRIPIFFSAKQRKAQIRLFKEWAKKKIKQNPQYFADRNQPTYHNGQRLKVGNREYILKIEYKDKKTSSAKIQGNLIHFRISSRLEHKKIKRHISTLLSRCVAHDRLPALKRKINELNNKYFHLKLGKISFKYNKSNWGSCSALGNINISTRLLFAPEDIIEYVCVHELAHLIELNHSKKFWQLVSRAVPDYKEKRRWLRQNADYCWY